MITIARQGSATFCPDRPLQTITYAVRYAQGVLLLKKSLKKSGMLYGPVAPLVTNDCCSVSW